MTRTLLISELARRGGFDGDLSREVVNTIRASEMMCRQAHMGWYVSYALHLCALSFSVDCNGGSWRAEAHR